MKNTEENQLKIISTIEKVKSDAKQYLMETTVKSDSELNGLIETYKDVEINDKASYDFMVNGAKELKKIRVIIDKNRKEITGPLVEVQKDIIKFVDPYISTISEAEKGIKQKIKDFEDKAKAEAERLFAERCKLLSDNGFQLVSGNYVCGAVFLNEKQIQEFDDEKLNFYINIGQQEVARRKAEDERIKKQKEDLERRERELLERESELLKRESELKKYIEVVNIEIEKISSEPKKTIEENVNTKSDLENKQEQETEPEQQIEKTEFQQGFDAFRNLLLELLASENKLTRPILIEWTKQQ